jgi:hypothetical protein
LVRHGVGTDFLVSTLLSASSSSSSPLVAVAYVNDAFVTYALSWMCNFARLAAESTSSSSSLSTSTSAASASAVVLVATDARAFRRLVSGARSVLAASIGAALPPLTVVLTPFCGDGGDCAAGLAYGTQAYWTFLRSRVRSLQRLMRLVSDRVPFVYFLSPARTRR